MSIPERCACREAGPVGPILYKLQRQIVTFGTSQAGMPPPWVYRGSDEALMLSDGVTRATRIAKLCPHTTIRVEVINTVKVPLGHFPKVGDLLP